MKCTCRIAQTMAGTFIEKCDLCEAAPSLYSALDTAMRLLREVWHDNPNHPIWVEGPAALAAAGETPLQRKMREMKENRR